MRLQDIVVNAIVNCEHGRISNTAIKRTHQVKSIHWNHARIGQPTELNSVVPHRAWSGPFLSRGELVVRRKPLRVLRSYCRVVRVFC